MGMNNVWAFKCGSSSFKKLGISVGMTRSIQLDGFDGLTKASEVLNLHSETRLQ